MRNWEQLKSKIFSVDGLAYLLIFFYIIIFVFLSFGRHDNLGTFLNDLGTYDQIVWNSLHGNLFQTSSGLYANADNFSYLSGHFSPMLLIFVPFYLILASAKTLLFFQAVTVGLGGLPIYWFARDKIKSRLAGLIFLISYLFYPVLHNALLYDFHEVTFAVPFVTFALYFLLKKRYGLMSLFLVLVCLLQEHLSLIVFMTGLYLMLINKKWKLGGLIALLSLSYFIIVVTMVMPYFSVSHGVDVIKSPYGQATRYSWLGGSVGEIAKTIFTKPLWLIKNLLSARRIDFSVTLLLPLFGLPLFSLFTILSLPVLAIYYLSSYWLTYSIYFYHSSVLAGIFYFASILAFGRLFRDRKWQRIFLILILISSILVGYIYSVTPFGKNNVLAEYQPSENARLLKEVKKIVPADATLSIQHNLGSHFTDRRKLYRFPLNFDKADFVVVDVYNPFLINPKSIFGLADVTQMEYKSWKFIIESLLNSPDYGVIFSQDGWLVFQKGAKRDLNEKAVKDYLIARNKLEAGLTKKDL